MKIPIGSAEKAVPLAAGAALLVAGAWGALHLESYLMHELGLIAAATGLILLGSAVAAWLGHPDGRPSWAHRVVRTASATLPALSVVAAVCLVYSYLVRGEMPWSHDHPVHLFKAWHLSENLIATGRISGWSNFLWAGYPAGTLYPMLSDMLVVVVRAVTFNQAPWPVAYAWSLLVMLLSYHLGIYTLGRRWFGPWAGTAAALFALMDRGAAREGSYYWTMHYGVWPMALATALWFFALDRLLAVLEKPTAGRVAGFAVLLGLALLGHPMTLTFSAVIFPLAMLLHVLRNRGVSATAPVWAGVGALLLGAMLAAFWYGPFLAHEDLVGQYGDGWLSIPEIGERLAASSLFDATLALPLALGLGGAVLAWTQGHRAGREVTVLTAGLMLAVCSTVYQMVDLESVYEGFNIVHFRRFTYALKMFWFVLAGYAVTGGAGQLLRSVQATAGMRPLAGWQKAAWIAVCAVLFTPLLESFVVGLINGPLKEIGSEKPLDEQGHSTPFQDSNEWFAEHTDPKDPFYRILYDVGGSRHLFNAAPVFTGRPAVVTTNDVPATSFTRSFRNSSVSTMEIQQVRYVVALDEFMANKKDLEEVYRKDRLRIYRFKGYRAQPFRVEGKAQAKLLEFTDELVRIRVKDPAPDDRLTLYVTELDYWHAYIDKTPVPIRIVEGNTHARWLMDVPLTKAGTLEFVYERGLDSRLGLVATAAALVTVLILALGGRPMRRLWLALPGSMKARRILHLLSTPALALLAALGLAGVVTLVATSSRNDASYRLSDHLEQASVAAEGDDMHIDCTLTFDRRIECENGQTLDIYKGAKRSGRDQSRIISGILVRPFFKLETILTLPGVRMGKQVSVMCGSDYYDNIGKGTVDVTLSFGARKIGKLACPANGNWKEQAFPTPDLVGKDGKLVLNVGSSPNRSPRLVIEAEITR